MLNKTSHFKDILQIKFKDKANTMLGNEFTLIKDPLRIFFCYLCLKIRGCALVDECSLLRIIQYANDE